MQGSIIGVIKGDARSLGYNSHGPMAEALLADSCDFGLDMPMLVLWGFAWQKDRIQTAPTPYILICDLYQLSQPV